MLAFRREKQVSVISSPFSGGYSRSRRGIGGHRHGSRQQVTHVPRKTATHPGQSGHSSPGWEYLKTGVKSRAEIELANQSVTGWEQTPFSIIPLRITKSICRRAPSCFQAKGRQADEYQTASVTAAVVGTTGFVQEHGKSFLFGWSRDTPP